MVVVGRSETREEAARLEAAVERLHGAQVEAVASGWRASLDLCEAERLVLEGVGEIGAMVPGLARGEIDDVDVRRKLVGLAAGGANGLAALVDLGLGLEPAWPAAGPGAAAGGAGGGEGQTGRQAAEASNGGGKGGRAAGKGPTSMRAVSDAQQLLVDQLKRLMQNADREESWRKATPVELWRRLLVQVAALFRLVVGLELEGSLGEADQGELARLSADAAVYLAFLRFYPRQPTV